MKAAVNACGIGMDVCFMAWDDVRLLSATRTRLTVEADCPYLPNLARRFFQLRRCQALLCGFVQEKALVLGPQTTLSAAKR
jgi:hypothetical protein